MSEQMKRVPRIAITGTKGKTTVTNILAQVFLTLHHNVMHVNTTGHFVNGERRSTLADSKRYWGLVPSVCPGRYLYEFFERPELQENGIAVLESSLGSSSLSGFGIGSIDIGVFLNVFEDHIGSSGRINSKEDIVIAKRFVFQRLAVEGVAVCNADDSFVVSALTHIPDQLDASVIPFGIRFDHFDLEAHKEKGGIWVTVKEEVITICRKDEEIPFIALSDLIWTFNGSFTPSVYNALAAVSACVAHYGLDTLPEGLAEAFRTTRLDRKGGRLTLLKGSNGTTILADYAHEKFSLQEVGKLARSLAGEHGKTIGVVRLAFDRTDDLIKETGEAIANSYDQFIVYDKIDGHFRMPRERLISKRFPKEIVGHVSELLSGAISSINSNCERVIREDEALRRAAELAGPDDVVVHIVNDDIERSISFIKDAFDADIV